MTNENIKPTKITFQDVCEIAFRLNNTDDFDFSATTDLLTIGNMPVLTDADKCVLGLALAFWSNKTDEMKDDEHNHLFSIHDFYASASLMENIFKHHGDVDCGFTSSAPFVKTTVDAAFVIINSMSRGFNVKFIKRFGGDVHLQWLAALFDIIVCRKYMDMFCDYQNSSDKGYLKYVDYFLKRFADNGVVVTQDRSHEMYAQLLTWIRTKLNVALEVYKNGFKYKCDPIKLVQDFYDMVSQTEKHNHICTIIRNPKRSREERVRLHASSCQNRSNTTPEEPAKKVETKKYGAGYDQILDFNINGHRFTLKHRCGSMSEHSFHVYDIEGTVTREDINMVRRLGYLDDEIYEISADGKKLVQNTGKVVTKIAIKE